MAEKPFDKEASWSDTGKQQTPYMKAKQVWDDRIGRAVVQAKNWRIVALICSALALGLLIALVMSMVKKENHVFVAQVTKTGQVVNVLEMKQAYEPTQAQETYFIGQFIRNLRSIPLDPVVARNNWVDAHNFLTSTAVQEFQKYVVESEKQLGKQTVTVQLKNINALQGSRSFEASWEETATGKNGQVLNTKNYSGTFTIAVIPPKTTAQILHNPLGIYIQHFSFREQAQS